MKKVMLTTTVLFMLMGCQKNTVLKETNNHLVQQSTVYHSINDRAANMDNPMDWMGTRHNRLLDSAVLFAKHNRPSDLQSIYGVMQKCYPQFVSDETSRIYQYLPNITPQLQKALLNNVDSLIITNIKEPLTQKYILSILNAIRTTTTADYSKTKNRITSVEKQIQDDKMLRHPDRNMLLSMASVTRHSFSYWLNKSASGPMETMGFFRWLAAAANAAVADASAIALCSFLQLPLTWWPDIASVASTGAYGTIMGWW